MNKKYFAMLAAAALVMVVLAGCKKDEPVNTSNGSPADIKSDEAAVEEKAMQPGESIEDLEKMLKDAGVEITDDVQKTIDERKAEEANQ